MGINKIFTPLEVKSSTDEDLSFNDDTKPLPPDRRTYGPWQFVTLWVITGEFWVSSSTIVTDDNRIIQYRWMDHRVISHCLRLECVAMHDHRYHRQPDRWSDVRAKWRPRCEVAHWLSNYHACILGNTRLCFHHHPTLLPGLHLVFDPSLLGRAVPSCSAHSYLALLSKPQTATRKWHDDHW